MAKNKKLKVDGARLQDSLPQPKIAEPENDYETQNHMRTLMDAHEIMNNPDKMEKVHKLAGRHAKAIRGIKDISDYKNAKYGGQKNLSQLNPSEDMEGDGE
jgi:hypothetical protein